MELDGLIELLPISKYGRQVVETEAEVVAGIIFILHATQLQPSAKQPLGLLKIPQFRVGIA